MQMYVDDQNHIFPGIASRRFGFQPSDWIYWRTNSALYPPFEKSPILTAIPGARRATFRCPLDANDNDRLAYAYDEEPSPVYGPYLFSYGLTGYGLDPNGQNVGMSSVLGVYHGVNLVRPFRDNNVRDPSRKIMLAEEPGSLSKHDSPDGAALIQDGRWIPAPVTGSAFNPLTIRHGGKGDVAFVDGHVENVKTDFAFDINNSLPNL
jgi:prepilin-type processing-associated H-X9-DG protein